MWMQRECGDTVFESIEASDIFHRSKLYKKLFGVKHCIAYLFVICGYMHMAVDYCKNIPSFFFIWESFADK